MRDVYTVQHERLLRALDEQQPSFDSMEPDERVERDRYNEQDVEVVLDQLATAAEALAEALDERSPQEWSRTGVYNWPEPAERTMAWLARHTLHEGVHHLDDMTEVIERVRAGRGGW